MAKVIKELAVGKYRLLTLDKPDNVQDFTHYEIDGKSYAFVPLYDIPNCIAIEANESFLGKTVVFKK